MQSAPTLDFEDAALQSAADLVQRFKAAHLEHMVLRRKWGDGVQLGSGALFARGKGRAHLGRTQTVYYICLSTEKHHFSFHSFHSVWTVWWLKTFFLKHQVFKEPLVDPTTQGTSLADAFMKSKLNLQPLKLQTSTLTTEVDLCPTFVYFYQTVLPQ